MNIIQMCAMRCAVQSHAVIMQCVDQEATYVM